VLPWLGEPGHEPYRSSLRRNHSIGRLAAHDREGDARHLIGKRYGDKLEGLLLDQLLGPHPQRVGVRLTVKEHGMRPDAKLNRGSDQSTLSAGKTSRARP
jgi:hypothetical protein